MSRLIDLTGQTFRTRKVLSRGVNPHGQGQQAAFWVTLCDPALNGCGKTTTTSSQSLRRGYDCECQKTFKNFRDWVGHVNKNLKVLKVLHEKRRTYSRSKIWLCECLLCGKEFEATGHELGGVGKRPPRDSCGCDQWVKLALKVPRGEKHPKWKGGWTHSRIERTCAYANRRAKNRGDKGRLTLEFVLATWRKQEGKCFYCGIKMLQVGGSHRSVEVDHKTPVNKKHKGKNVPRNTCLSCHACNYEKRNKTAKEYLRWRRKKGLRMNPKR